MRIEGTEKTFSVRTTSTSLNYSTSQASTNSPKADDRFYLCLFLICLKTNGWNELISDTVNSTGLKLKPRLLLIFYFISLTHFLLLIHPDCPILLQVGYTLLRRWIGWIVIASITRCSLDRAGQSLTVARSYVGCSIFWKLSEYFSFVDVLLWIICQHEHWIIFYGTVFI